MELPFIFEFVIFSWILWQSGVATKIIVISLFLASISSCPLVLVLFEDYFKCYGWSLLTFTEIPKIAIIYCHSYYLFVTVSLIGQVLY